MGHTGRSEKGWKEQPGCKASGKTSWLSLCGDFEYRLFIWEVILENTIGENIDNTKKGIKQIVTMP